MELLAYIKELLLLNDCVIIPGFGGFVTNYKQAGLQASQLTPPQKSVSFNKKLNFNDGLFINHVATKEGLNYITARKKVDRMVQELNYRLTDGEEISITGLGSLHYDEQQHLVFSPKVEGNLNLDAFGLNPFSYESLFARQVARKAIFQQEHPAADVIFPKRNLKKVLVAVPLLLALAVIPLKNNVSNIQQSDLVNIKGMMMATEVSLNTENGSRAETASVPNDAPETESNEAVDPSAEVPARYFLIAGSFRNSSNAQLFISQLDDKGFQGTDLGVIKGLHYISLGGFVTIDEALSACTNYKSQSPGSGAWIYKKNESE